VFVCLCVCYGLMPEINVHSLSRKRYRGTLQSQCHESD